MKSILRPRQLDAIRGVAAARRRGETRIVLQAATGFGKSVVIAALVESVINSGRRIAVIVPRLDLIDGMLDRLDGEGLGDRVGVMQGAHARTDAKAAIQLVSAQTVARRAPPDVDAVLIDEVHIGFEALARWMRHPDWRERPFLGLSATPWRRGMAQDWRVLVQAGTIAELTAEALLAPLKIVAPVNPDLRSVRVRAGDYATDDLSRLMRAQALVNSTADEWIARGEGRPTLAFGVDRLHGQALRDALVARGVRAGYVDGETPREERAAARRALASGELQVLASCETMTVGVDIPGASCILLARPTRSPMLAVQICGRGLRRAPGKTDCLLLDVAGVTLALGRPDEIGFEGLDDGVNPPRPTARTAVAVCDACAAVIPRASASCPCCGRERVRRSSYLDARIEQAKADVAERMEWQRWIAGLQWIASDRGYRPGWVDAKFRERFGVWPPRDIRIGPGRPREDIFRFVADSLARWRAGRAA